MKTRPALTLVELVLIMGLIVILTVPAVISFSGFRNRHALKASGEGFANVLRTARVNAREERDEKAWGVRYINSNTYSMISGSQSSFTVIGAYVLNPPVGFAGSFENIWFGQSTGATGQPYRIELVVPAGQKAAVEINTAGIIKYVPL